MDKQWIKNFDKLARTTPRRDALDILEAGYNSINTTCVVRKNIQVNETTLTVRGQEFQINDYENIFLIGFGKGSCEAVFEINSILTTHIKKGVVIDRSVLNTCPVDIEAFVGTHPLPSEANVQATLVLEDVAAKAGEHDLVIVVIAGGGSALLCASEDERRQNTLLFEEFLKVGTPISETNLVRKHLSTLKGGGLAKVLYPATVIGLVFSDIMGGHPEEVASGPTYFDSSTTDDALAVLNKYNLADKFQLSETPKETKYFDKVHNIVLISNEEALEAMKEMVEEKGYKAVIVPGPLYEAPEDMLHMLYVKRAPGTVVLAGGEIRYVVPENHGAGGRCQFLALHAMKSLPAGGILVAAASDGRDNSDKAGALVDDETVHRAREANIDIESYIERCDTVSVFEQLGDELLTGPTQANVADWYFLLTAHE